MIEWFAIDTISSDFLDEFSDRPIFPIDYPADHPPSVKILSPSLGQPKASRPIVVAARRFLLGLNRREVFVKPRGQAMAVILAFMVVSNASVVNATTGRPASHDRRNSGGYSQRSWRMTDPNRNP